MKNVDLLITWHESCDYPVARLFLKRHHKFFNKIIIYFSKHHREPVFTDFLKSSMKDLGNIVFLDPIEYKYGEEDWRQVATNYMLKYSNSEWISSIEGDWFSSDWYRLLDITQKAMEASDMVGWMNMTNAPYIHPSYFFAKRELIESAGNDFTPHPEVNGGDHFAAITWKAKELGAKIMELPIGECVPNSLGFHLGGVNQNYLEGLKDGHEFHRKEIFSVYNYFSQVAEVTQSPEFMDLCQKIGNKLSPTLEDIEKWRIFFK